MALPVVEQLQRIFRRTGETAGLVQEQKANVPEPTTSLPSDDLIFLVNGHRDQHQYAISRRATTDNIVSLLGEGGIDFKTFASILDFGCGCGRILAGWEGMLSSSTYLAGVDINETLLAFCRSNIPFADVYKSNSYPPLRFGDKTFDFVYAASVFTHLTLPATLCWAGELARLIKPGGILMASYHGSYFLPTLAGVSAEGSRLLEERGYHTHCAWVNG